jgi:hypothetical protein
MSAASTQRTCGRKPPRVPVMSNAERRSMDSAYRRNVRDGSLTVPVYARKTMKLDEREES